MRRRRFQKPEPKKRKHGRHLVWIGQWRDLEGIRRTKVLGKCLDLTKSDAELRLAAILQPVNAGTQKRQVPLFTFQQFVNGVYLPVRRRKWKKSTAGTSEQNIQFHLMRSLGPRLLRDIDREELQALLDAKATTSSRSIVDHLRWHLVSIYRLAISEGAADRNPALGLHTPRCRAGKERRSLSVDEVMNLLSALDLREKLICRLAIYEGMRPGEILALQWQDIGGESFDVRRRVYRGDLDSPKTRKSARMGGLSHGTIQLLTAWRELARDPRPEGFVFPSENISTPLSRDNVWRRNIRPRLEPIGLEWANFQVMRRTNDNLGRKAGIDDKVLADQRGHGVGVSLEVYANSDLEQKLEAVRKLEQAIQ